MSSFPNFRDLGGHRALDGKKIRPGLLYRSGQLGTMSKGEADMVLSLGIRTVVDLRSVRESAKCRSVGEGVSTICLPIELEAKYRKRVQPVLYRKNTRAAIASIVASVYAELVKDEMITIQRLFGILAAPHNYPLLIHCRAGQDRTGFVCAIILLSLGVDKDVIIRDYLLSTGYSIPRVRTMARILRAVSLGIVSTDNFEEAFTAHEKYVQAVFDEIAAAFGTIDGYLKSCGVPEAALREFRGFVLG
jgi:protein-tyrosine phosphatase